MKWECEKETVRSMLQFTLNSMTRDGFHHYELSDFNPPLSAAQHAARKHDITILSKGISSPGDFVYDYTPEHGSPLFGLRGVNDPIPTIDEIKQQLTPEVRQWIESLSAPEINELELQLTQYTPQKFIDGLFDQIENEERLVERIKKYQHNPELQPKLKFPWLSERTPEMRLEREQEVKAKTARLKAYLPEDLRQWFEKLPEVSQYSYGSVFIEEVAEMSVRRLRYTRAFRERIERMYFNGEKQVFP